MVSVIVPIYNSDKYLKRCLNSIIGQTYRDIEVILVDDGSADASWGICEKYASIDSRISVIHQAHEGVSSARNKGLEVACGEWIAFVDSDDWLEPDYVSTLLQYSNDQDVVISGYPNNETYTAGGLVEYVSNVAKTFSANVCHHKIISAHLIHANKLKFEERFSLGEDSIFSLWVLLYCNSIRIIDYKGYHFRQSRLPISEKYQQTTDDIHDKIKELRTIYNLIGQRFGCHFDIDDEIRVNIAFYPISSILNGNESVYMNLWKYYFGEEKAEDLYQDTICSPIINAITFAKQLSVAFEYRMMAEVISKANNLWRDKVRKDICPYKSHRIVANFLSKGHERIAVVFLIGYSLWMAMIGVRKPNSIL